MELNHFPDEVLSNVFNHLTTRAQKHRLHDDFIVDIWPVRLVCRRWNVLATPQLFQTLTLFHSEWNANKDFEFWKHMLASNAIRAAARRVAIESAPWDDLDERSSWVWEDWRDDYDWPQFKTAIDHICDMPHLNALEGRSRFHEKRATRPNTSVIRELVLDNLQNIPLPKDLTDGLLENIERLHILTTQEISGIPTKDAHLREIREWEPYLQNTLLHSVAEQLVELTLSSPAKWGAIPSEFNGKGLHFPRLKALTLAEHVIARQDQFEWVLSLESLTSLCLHGCTIATHVLVLEPEFAFWGVDMRGWTWVADLPELDDDDESRPAYEISAGKRTLTPGFYVHSLRWNAMFDSIRERLPRLTEFRFTKEDWNTFFRHKGEANAEALVDRYFAFTQYWCELWSFNLKECNYVEENRPGLPEELLKMTEEADRGALQRLLQTTRERQMMVKSG
ncbi:F-box domain-containing protein [Fusarium sp. LHS14.1]|nr:F-box domain-containing protein [Fusarium sp. LHS14.1]